MDKHRLANKIEPDLRACLNLLIEGKSAWPLFMFGSAGTGKSCAALCLLDYAGGRYYALPTLLDDLIRAWQGRLETDAGAKMYAESIWHRIREAPLMVLDEIGCREKVTDAHYETVKRVLDIREGLPFVAISNLEPETIREVYDDRIYSRLMSGTVWDSSGKDRRLSP